MDTEQRLRNRPFTSRDEMRDPGRLREPAAVRYPQQPTHLRKQRDFEQPHPELCSPLPTDRLDRVWRHGPFLTSGCRKENIPPCGKL